jgi:integrase
VQGVKTPTVPVKPYTIITPEQFSAVYEALPDPMWRLLVETDIESGLRWGELTELRVRDLEFGSRMLTVSRTVVQVSPKFHPAGGRFLVKDYPKDREFRRFKLSVQIVAKLQAHVVEHGLGRDDLLFWAPEPDGPRVRNCGWSWTRRRSG